MFAGSLTFVFLPRHAQPVVQCSGPGTQGNGFQPLQIGISHRLSPQVATGNKGKIIIESSQLGFPLLNEFQLVFAHRTRLPVLHPNIALKDLEPSADFVNSVIEGFEFGGFVDHIFRRGDFAAVM